MPGICRGRREASEGETRTHPLAKSARAGQSPAPTEFTEGAKYAKQSKTKQDKAKRGRAPLVRGLPQKSSMLL